MAEALEILWKSTTVACPYMAYIIQRNRHINWGSTNLVDTSKTSTQKDIILSSMRIYNGLKKNSSKGFPEKVVLKLKPAESLEMKQVSRKGKGISKRGNGIDGENMPCDRRNKA